MTIKSIVLTLFTEDPVMENYLVVIERGEYNLSAYSPDVVGCVATGATVEEVIQQMREALSLHLEDLFWQGEPLPKSQGLAFHLDSIQPRTGDLFTFIPIELNPVRGNNDVQHSPISQPLDFPKDTTPPGAQRAVLSGQSDALDS
jgi:predicted RNase H-like HicB family nuclease